MANFFLGKAIESILNQSFSKFELIIVNDNSTDKTQQIIEQYHPRDNRIFFKNNEIQCGPSKTSNRGIAIASGTYIARMDADDISHPLRFEKQIVF